MLNLKITTTTLVCFSSAKQHQFTVHKGICTCTHKYYLRFMSWSLGYTCVVYGICNS